MKVRAMFSRFSFRFRPRFWLLPAILALPAAAAAQQPQPQRPATARPAQAPATSSQPRPAQAPAAAPAQARPAQAPAAAPSQARPAQATPARPAPAQPAPAAGARPAAPAASPVGGDARQLAVHGDWAVYVAQDGGQKTCFTTTQPKERLPAGLNRDPAYLFVSYRPQDNVRDEIALVMGFPTKDGGAGEAVIGTATYGLLTKGRAAWLRNIAEQNQVIAAMVRGQSLTVKTLSSRGNALTDLYSLSGFTQALERARKECP